MTEIPEAGVWLIFLLPLLSFVVISFVIRPFFNNKALYAGYLTIGCIAASLALALWTLISVNSNGELLLETHEWAVIGSTTINMGVMVDSLTAVMVVIITICSLMVQIYSQGYMHGDQGYCRYYAFMSLFTASMLGLVLADNLVQLFVFWELVGLCSYLLIGFWFHRPSAAAAAKKAFLVTRLGDFGFLAAILYLYFRADTLDIAELHHLAITGALAGGVLTWAAIGIFSGAVGKSAQFPLHVWLPDAMEGPTPVSALIHSSTMVTAGVFLVARSFPIFVGSETALTVVAAIGAFTAIFAASMALVANDIKRVLAYCTISQLGYMMLGLGAVGLVLYPELVHEGAEPLHAANAITFLAIFHLFNHAFTKALLFLAAGSVNHATGTFDMREMGGLRQHMRWTYLVYLIATISIAGIWPLACFWSKDEIVAVASDLGSARSILFYLAVITVFMTAFYMFRTVFMTFHGEYRGKTAGHGEHGGHGGLHESPRVMLIPMFILAALAVGSGWANVNGWFGRFFGEHIDQSGAFFVKVFSQGYLPVTSLIIALLGVGFAYAVYIRTRPSAESIGRKFSPLYTLFSRKYWMDELYERFFVVRVLVDGIFWVLHLFDTYIIDGVVNGIAGGTIGGGRIIRRAQTGRLQAYGLVMFVGILVIVGCIYLFGR
jgi:NADH-quinone oxidoreductase subunit L